MVHVCSPQPILLARRQAHDVFVCVGIEWEKQLGTSTGGIKGNTSTSQLKRLSPSALGGSQRRDVVARCERPIWSATKSHVPLKTTVIGRGEVTKCAL